MRSQFSRPSLLATEEESKVFYQLLAFVLLNSDVHLRGVLDFVGVSGSAAWSWPLLELSRFIFFSELMVCCPGIAIQ